MRDNCGIYGGKWDRASLYLILWFVDVDGADDVGYMVVSETELVYTWYSGLLRRS